MAQILWLSSITCNGNSHSFLNYPNLDEFLKQHTFLYHPILPNSYSLKDVFEQDLSFGVDILIIEGTLDSSLEKFGKNFESVLLKYALNARYILTVGTCATFGGIFMQKHPNRYGFLYKNSTLHNKFLAFRDKTISISGCPIQAEVLAGVIDMIDSNLKIHLDEYNRPKEFYGWTIHNGCTRNEYFEYKIDNHKFGELEGCMFYEHGCQATYTHGSCNKILWNGINSKTRAGEPCHGCTEPDFPKDNLWQTKKHMGIPATLPFGVPKRAYLSLAGVAKAFKIDRFYKKILDDK